MHRAAALATSCRIELVETEELYDIRQNGVLIEEYRKVTQEQYCMGLNSVEGAIGGSTDFVSGLHCSIRPC